MVRLRHLALLCKAFLVAFVPGGPRSVLGFAAVQVDNGPLPRDGFGVLCVFHLRFAGLALGTSVASFSFLFFENLHLADFEPGQLDLTLRRLVRHYREVAEAAVDPTLNVVEFPQFARLQVTKGFFVVFDF